MADGNHVANYSDCFEAYERAQAAQAALTPVEQATAKTPHAFGLLLETDGFSGLDMLDGRIVGVEGIGLENLFRKNRRGLEVSSTPSIRAQLALELGGRHKLTRGDVQRAYERAIEAYHNDPTRRTYSFVPKLLRVQDDPDGVYLEGSDVTPLNETGLDGDVLATLSKMGISKQEALDIVNSRLSLGLSSDIRYIIAAAGEPNLGATLPDAHEESADDADLMEANGITEFTPDDLVGLGGTYGLHKEDLDEDSLNSGNRPSADEEEEELPDF